MTNKNEHITFARPNASIQDSLSHYLQKASKYPMLKAEEEHQLARDWVEKQDKKSIDKLINSHLRLVTKIAAGYKGYGLPLHDLIAEGNIGIMQAAKKFDPDKGFRFSTYAMWWIKASIKDYILKSWSLVRTGTTASQKKLFFNLRSLKKKLASAEESYFSDETIDAISAELGVSKKDVVDMEQRLSSQDLSLNTPIGTEGDGEWQDWISDEKRNQEAELAHNDEFDKRKALLEAAMQKLSKREYDVLMARRFHEPPQTLEVVSNTIGVSRERIRQIEMQAFQKIQKDVRAQAFNKNLMN